MKHIMGCVVFFCCAQICVGQIQSWHADIKRISKQQQKELDEKYRDYADGALPDPLTKVKAFAILLNTQTFANEAVGLGGSMSNQVKAFQVVLTQPDAKNAFADLLNRGTKAGQLYALCGLYIKDRRKFVAEYPRSLDPKKK